MLGKEYFEDLSDADRAKMQTLLERMATHGEIRNKEKFRHEGDGFYCFKSFKRRLMCFFDRNDIVITHGFTKKRDRLDPRELDRARRIKNTYTRP
jgi:mRNA-degrading endonuclease RelE of RelBE toxin-antitoxin system